MNPRIQSNQNKVVAKAKMINLGLALNGCTIFCAVPEKPGWDAERIAQGIRAEIVGLVQRASIPTIREIYEHEMMIQQKQEEALERSKN